MFILTRLPEGCHVKGKKLCFVDLEKRFYKQKGSALGWLMTKKGVRAALVRSVMR